MPDTTPDGFEYESLGDGNQGRTLHGGQHGDSPILAKQVQAKFQTTDAAIADLSSRGGWFPVANGQIQSVASFDIDLTAGGQFPVGTFTTFKLVAVGRGNGSTEVQMRVNDLATAVYRRATITIDAASNTVDGSQSDSDPQWFLTEWGGGAGVYNPVEATISIINDICTAQWQGTNVSGNTVSHGGGKINDVVFPAKLTLMVGGGAATEFLDIRWEVSGYSAGSVSP